MGGDGVVDGGFGVRGEEIRRAAHAHVVDGAGDGTYYSAINKNR